MINQSTLTMDGVELHNGDLFIVMEPNKIPTVRVTTSYSEAVSWKHRHTENGVIFMVTGDTIAKVLSDPNNINREVIV